MIKIVAAVVLLLLLVCFACAQEPLIIPVYEGSMARYKQFIAEKGSDPQRINNFASDYASRVIVEMVLIQQALRLGGLDAAVQFIPVPNTARGENMLRSGQAVMLGYSIWQTSFTPDMYMSDAVIKSGDFLKVIVGRADDRRLKALQTTEDLRELVAVTGDSWTEDIQTLKAMGLEKIQTVPIYDLQFACILKKRADFGLYEFSGSAMSQALAARGLAIAPGITVGIRCSRHFMVSKTHPEGHAVFKALQSGLAQLRQQCTLRKAYSECGFYAKELADWKCICPSGQKRQ